MEKLLHKIKENKKIIYFILIFLVAFFVSIPMLNRNIDIYYDDGSQHLMRAYWSYKAFLENGNSMVIFDFSNGFGYSWDLFYGPLSTWLIIIFGIVFGTFNLGFKIALFFIIFCAGIMMYKFVYGLTDKENTALLASIIYITSPYFFTDIYARHAIGECMAFVFVPLVFLGLYNLFNTEKNHYYLIFGVVRIDSFS